MMESSKISDVTKIIDRYDAYEWYLQLGPLSNATLNTFKEAAELERLRQSS